MTHLGLVLRLGSLLLSLAEAVEAQSTAELPRSFHWESSPPLLTARDVDGWPWHAVKDPSIVRHDGHWHLFVTVRGSDRSHAIVYLNFRDWADADSAERHVLPMHAGYFCAPQVFWFSPQQKWYLICQAADTRWGDPPYRPAFATTATLDDPDSWTPLQPLFTEKPDGLSGWIDFWVICDEDSAHLFFTSNDGNMWRCETTLAAFPRGWSHPEVVLREDIFEASHTYRVKDADRYITVVEAQSGDGWRTQKLFEADRLDGEWRPIAASREHPFASLANVSQGDTRWTDCISHAELLRSGFDERLEVDPADLQLLYQGVLDADRAGKGYGDIPWKLGLLKLTSPPRE